MTMSPSPNKESFGGSANRSIGNNNLIGAFKFFATVTITSVPYTQKISYKNNPHNKMNPTLKLGREIL